MKILVEKELVEQATVCIEQAQIYHDALSAIMKADSLEKAKELAVNALEHALDYNSLSNEYLERIK